ncbi:hypothetical protein K450DRAFT_243462 [Umbelopsis ramanniana AG]|uniref:Gamma-soluble NSF attachment protein n=1 Tax=Umbelopsis ramanniana AG TaxID=1314678 RepID=A0AAD5HCN2_UMBRA|nr:uncharacterized protein K450DRAFT_243462 [Umbelopsis ramanniana AG]KAI8579242.1 hypothetical protein K450DRAFT_243462 [Umbelopsis ramanniana AG]
MEAERIKTAVKLMQDGDKASQKGLFKKPDWDIAGQNYERAATAFKVGKSYEQAVQAYNKASEALLKADATHLAGKAMESAAQILAQNLHQPDRAADAYRRASELFVTQGSVDRGAEQLEKAAKVMENVDVNAAIDLYSQSCSLYEQEDRGRFAMDTFKKAISLLVKTQKYDRAADMLNRQSVVLQKMTNRGALHKANLSIVILSLAMGDEVEANKQFHNFCSRDAGFPQSEEAEISDDLIKAYEHGDGELLAKTVRRQNITFLDNEIARLARSLGVPGENIRSNNYGAPQAAGNAYPQQSYGDDLM